MENLTAEQNITAQAFRDKGRVVLENSGLTYRDFNVYNIALLESILEDELSKHENLPMKIDRPLKKDFKFNVDGSLSHGYFKVKSSYFIKREAISFNDNGFVGFAGWADKFNVQPFVNAFIKWLDRLSTPIKTENSPDIYTKD